MEEGLSTEELTAMLEASPLAQKFASPGSSPPSRAHFEHGTWYQKHDGLDDAAPPVRPYPEAVAESWEQHQQAAVLYEDALQHKRPKALRYVHAWKQQHHQRVPEQCELALEGQGLTCANATWSTAKQCPLKLTCEIYTGAWS